MKQLIQKLFFAANITAGFSSFARLLWHSKKLRWSKTGFLDSIPLTEPAIIYLNLPGKKKKLFLRTYDGDIDIFYEIFWKKVYDLPQLEQGKIRTIVDLGANVGLSALYFLGKYPLATVICAEPEPSNFALLSKNLSPEIANGKVKALEAAIMGNDGSVAFESAATKYNSKVAEGQERKNTKAVSVPTLLDIYHIAHIDLLKIDVEGAEQSIFATNTEWLCNVDNIIIELHSAEAHKVCMATLAQYGFAVNPLNAPPTNGNLYLASRF